MEYLAIKITTGRMYCQSREERELGINYCIRNNIPITSIVEKVFDSKNEATKFCNKINDVNNLINEI